MSYILNQGDISRLKYLVVWTYEVQDSYILSKSPPTIRLRTEFAESEEDVWKIVFNESLRHSVSERKRTEPGCSSTEFYLSPSFKVEVFSLSWARGFNDQAFIEKITETIARRVKHEQERADLHFEIASKKNQDREYTTYLALKAKYEKSEVVK